MAEQVEREEVLAAKRECLSPAEEMGRYEIARVLDQLILGQGGNQALHGARRHESKGETPQTLDQRMQPFGRDAQLKQSVDSLFTDGRHPGYLSRREQRADTWHRRRPRQSRSRSEERRVGKECRSRWSPYH